MAPPHAPERASHRPRRLAILGSTGSIGVNTLDVVTALPGEFEVLGLSAHSNWESLFAQAREHRPRYVVLTDPGAAAAADRSLLPPGTELLTGPDGVARIARDPDADVVVSAVVGAAGLDGSWHAVDAGKRLALANKETLVVAGPLVMDLARRSGAEVLPVDSEHSAIFQALCGHDRSEVERLVLTASGGPFRGWTRAELEGVTVEQALAHPTWRMGPKITIDSATLLNKALEVVEARWLFGLPAERIEVVVHPESVVHSLVEFVDGSVLAQLSPPDMRLPIQYALTYPRRVSGPAKRMDWKAAACLTFEPPDREAFPGLGLGFEAAARGGTCGAVLNAAKESAVDHFLAGELRFTEIAAACRAALDQHDFTAHPGLEELRAADRRARQEVERWTRLRRPARRA